MNYLKTFLILTPILFLLSGCFKAPEPNTITITETVPVDIPLVNRPKPPQLISPKIYVVTKDNYEEFQTRFTSANGELVFIAISIKDYENLSINLEEIKSYLLKQNEVIVYYEDAIENNGKQPQKEE